METSSQRPSPVIELSTEQCHRARIERDPAFDGRFFFAVKTTGIYCRPVCSARRARRENVRYFESATAAAVAGFRPCLKCRPEQAPRVQQAVGSTERAGLVNRALEFIEEGELDEGSVAGLAKRLGVGERRLRRAFDDAVGASPVKVAVNRRLLLARQMLTSTESSVIDIAYASGFNSLRRFNEAFKSAFDVSPSQLRGAQKEPLETGGDLALKLGVRGPFEGDALLKFLSVRAIPGVERVSLDSGGGCYQRTFRFRGATGLLSATLTNRGAAGEQRDDAVQVAVRFLERPDRLPSVLPLIERVKHIFDLSFDPEWLTPFVGDSLVGQQYAEAPGIRVPGCFDPFELTVRAVLGQQVTVAGATTLSGRLAARWGSPLGTTSEQQNLILFPDPAALVQAPLEDIGLPKARAATLRAVAGACLEFSDLFDRTQPFEDFVRRLCTVPGIGPWTAEYVAMRALHARDAFPASDLVLRKALAQPGQGLPSATEVRRRVEPFKPYRAYAAMLLWRSVAKQGHRK